MVEEASKDGKGMGVVGGDRLGLHWVSKLASRLPNDGISLTDLLGFLCSHSFIVAALGA